MVLFVRIQRSCCLVSLIESFLDVQLELPDMERIWPAAP